MSEAKSSRIASAASWLGKFAPSCALAGIIGIHLGAVPPIGGYGFFMIGLFCALLAVGFGIAGAVTTRKSENAADKTRAWLGLASGAVLITLTLLFAGGSSPEFGSAPPINDITTDLDDPPAFASPDDVPDFAGRDMSYPPEFVEIVRTSYPDLATIRLPGDSQEVFQRALRVAEDLDWEIVHEDEASGTIDARERTRLFQFVDDVTIRVRQDGAEVVVDVRSKSRDGRGDLGVNAQRIRTFQSALTET